MTDINKIDEMKLPELKEIAKEFGMKLPSSIKKAELKELIIEKINEEKSEKLLLFPMCSLNPCLS